MTNDEIFRACLEHFSSTFRSIRNMAQTLGFGPEYFHQVFTGKRAGSDDYRRNVAAALGFPGRRYEEFLEIGRNLRAGRPADGPPPEFPSDEELAAQGFMKVGFSDNMKLAAGGGGTIPLTEPAEKSKVVVHRASLGRGTYRPHQLQAFRVGGRSMEPVIAVGGIVLTDLTQNELISIKEGAIYVLCWDLHDGECAVKYLRWVKKNRLLSIESEDNKDYPAVFKEVEEVKLIGRVIWAWRKF